MHYGLNYFEHTLRKMSTTAEDITKRRWTFIRCTLAKSILDYGSGVPWFRAYRPDKNIIVDTYDISGIATTGINQMEYDLICFWDSLEHIKDLDAELGALLNRTKYVVVSIPIYLGDMHKDTNSKFLLWKHYRPFEHLHYFTFETLDEFFAKYGFKRWFSNQNECPPREDVWTILYKRFE